MSDKSSEDSTIDEKNDEKKSDLLSSVNLEIRHVETLFIRAFTPSILIISGVYVVATILSNQNFARFFAAFYILPIFMVLYRQVYRVDQLRRYATSLRKIDKESFNYNSSRADLLKITVPDIKNYESSVDGKWPYINSNPKTRIAALIVFILTAFSFFYFHIQSDPLIFAIANIDALLLIYVFFPHKIIDGLGSLFRTSEFMATENFLALFVVTIVLLLLFAKFTENYDKFL